MKVTASATNLLQKRKKNQEAAVLTDFPQWKRRFLFTPISLRQGLNTAKHSDSHGANVANITPLTTRKPRA